MSHTEHLWKRAHTLCSGLSHHLDEIYVSDYPTASPRELIRFFQSFLKKLAPVIDANRANLRALSWICYALQLYGNFLPGLEGASTAQTPRALVLLLQDLMRRLYPKSTLIAYPRTDSYNYSIIDQLPFFKNTLTNLLSPGDVDELLKVFEGPVNVISFPRIERDNILDHAVFGHELGHPIADDFLRIEEASVSSYQAALDEYTKKIRELVQDRIAAAGPAARTSFDILKLTKPFLEQLLEIRRRGLQELISDCVSVFLFGPSALFAAYDIFLKPQLDAEPSDPEYYPPSRFRLRIMRQLLEQEGYQTELMDIKPPRELKRLGKELEDFWHDITQLTNETSDIDRLRNDPITALAYEWLVKVLPNAIEYAKSKVEKLIYPPKRMRDEINELIQRLSLGIPPNELDAFPNTKSVDWRSAIVAGWLYKISGLSLPFKKGEELNVQHIDRINRLTMRAVELSIVPSEYLSTAKKGDKA